MAESRARKQEESLQLATAPEREDERLTNATVHTALLPLRRGPIPDLFREARLEKMRANVEHMQRKNAEERRAMLHTLYINAREFIVRPEQLDLAIDRAFDGPDLFLNDDTRGENVWHTGRPETAQALLYYAGHGRNPRAGDRFKWGRDLLEKRLDKIGAELTGGKM